MKTKTRAVWKIPVLLALCLVEALAGLYLIGLVGVGGGWIFACIPLLQTATAALFLFVRKKDANGERAPEEAAAQEKEPFGFKSIGKTVYAGAVIASALLLCAPLRLLTDKITGLLGFESMLPVTYMASPLMAAFVLLAVFPVASELLHRHLLQKRLLPGEKVGDLLLLSAFYALAMPLVNALLPRLVCGAALAWIYKNTRSHFSSGLAAFMTYILSLAYQFMLAYGRSDGSAMGWTSLIGFALICLASAGAAFLLAESIYKKRKPKKLEVFAFLLVFILLLTVGIALTAI